MAFDYIRNSYDVELEGFLKLRTLFAAFLLLIGTTTVLLFGDIPRGDELEHLIIFTIMFGVGLALFSKGFGALKKLQFVKGTPTSKVRSMAKGNVEISGQAKTLEDTLESPFMGEECLYYWYEVEEYKSSSSSKHRNREFKKIDRGENKVRFIIDDGTGFAVVDPEGADFDLEEENTITVPGNEDPPEQVQEFIENNDAVDSRNNKFLTSSDNKRRYTEKFVKPSEQLYVFGYSDSLVLDGESFNLVKDGGVPLFYISDKSEEEIIDKWSSYYKLALAASIIMVPIGYLAMLSLVGLI